MGEYDFKNLFPTFLDAKVSLTGGGEISVKEHIEERIEAYNSYRHKFSPTQIQNLRREDFHYFLTPSMGERLGVKSLSLTLLKYRCYP